MTKSYRKPKNITEILKSPKGIIINFSEIKHIKLTKNIEHCFVTGNVGKQHRIDSNFISSELFNLVAKGINWHRDDIKDCFIKNSEFRKANLDVSALMNNIVVNTLYEGCSFYDSTFTDTTFERVIFNNCDLTSLVIKRCSFTNCEFNLCKTSNKLIEHCVLESTSFSQTDIRLETILENFGTQGTLFNSGGIFVEGTRLSKAVSATEFRKLLQRESRLTSLEKFNLRFFMDSNFERAGEALDDALRLESWLPLCRIPSTFNNLLSGFSSFLINQYEADRIPVSPLLRLYTITTQFDKQSSSNQYFSDFKANWSSVSMRLLPYFENHLFWVDKIAQDDFPYAMLIVEGPIDKEYFTEFFSKTIQLKDFVIKQIIPRNSPAEILIFFQDHFSLAFLVSVFLSSRLKIEVESLRVNRIASVPQRALVAGIETRKAIKGRIQESVKNVEEKGVMPQVFSFEIGQPPELESTYRLRVAALFPERIAVNLQIDLRLSLIYKIRSILIEVLRPRK